MSRQKMIIRNWADIRDQFNNATIILGNGSSIAFDQRFQYESLLQTASDASLISPEVRRIFDLFSSDDFELVLHQLWRASQINQRLHIENEVLSTAYTDVRNALISTTRHTHGSFAEWATDANFLRQLDNAASFLSGFQTIFSLNYDCLLYWIILRGNDTLGNWFKDTFTDNGESRIDWDTLRTPFRATGASLVFYPHGNLCLAVNSNGITVKLNRRQSAIDLINHIARQWESNNVTPLFVCEGQSEHKLLRINSNTYLNRVYRQLCELRGFGNQIVIYGWDMRDQDMHILNALGRNDVERIAISVHNNDQLYCQRITQLISAQLPFIQNNNIFFYDSNSQGCWIHA